MSMKLRLLKVIVQPVFVKDDGEGLEEVTIQPVTVAAKQWPNFSVASFGEQDCAALVAQMSSAPSDQNGIS